MTSLLVAMVLARGLDEEAWPFNYVRPVKGGKYIFVMISPKEWQTHTYDYRLYRDNGTLRSDRRDGLLFRKYPISGLYPKDSTKPLWTVDWYSFDVRVCSDGEHLVRFGGWPRSGDEGKTLALAFYRSGKEIKRYEVRDLVADLNTLPHSVSHYQWKKSDGFDDVGKRLKIQLFQGYSYEAGPTLMFDCTTGERRSN